MVVEWTWGYGKRWIQEIEKLGYQKDHMHIINYDRGSETKAKLFLGMCKFVRFMTVHSSICAWRIPWTEEPWGLQFMWSQRVGHNSVTNTNTTEKECFLKSTLSCCSVESFTLNSSLKNSVLKWFYRYRFKIQMCPCLSCFMAFFFFFCIFHGSNKNG